MRRGSAFWFFPEEYTIQISLDGQHWSKVADNAGRRPFDDDRLEELLRLAVMNSAERARRKSSPPSGTKLLARSKPKRRSPRPGSANSSSPRSQATSCSAETRSDMATR